MAILKANSPRRLLAVLLTRRTRMSASASEILKKTKKKEDKVDKENEKDTKGGRKQNGLLSFIAKNKK